MGRVLAGILSRAIDEQTTDDRDREAVLVEAATADEVEREQLDRLLDEATTELPPEDTVRRLLEAASVQDVASAITDARADGDAFEGDEQGQGDEITVAAGARLLEAVGDGARPGTKRFRAVVIRPGEGKGHGNRIYTQRMLESNAGNFGGQPIFFNHEDLATILKRGHGSRDPRDLAGWLQEGTTYDPAYTEPDDAKEGWLPGAVMGEVDLLLEAATYAESLPNAVRLSINMDSTKLRAQRRKDGKFGQLVEGVVKGSGSVDLITGQAGAGGRVLERLREAANARYGSPHADLLDDDALLEAVKARPQLVAVVRELPDPDPDPEGLSGDMDPAKLIEAVSTDGAAAERLAAALAGTPTFDRLVEAKVQEERTAIADEIRADVDAERQRDIALRDMRDEAHRLIEAAGRPRGGILTPSYIEDLRGRYALGADGPSVALDLIDEVGDDGQVVKPAIERLREAVAADIAREEGKLRESAPTVIRDLGGAAPELDAEGNPKPPEAPKDPLAGELGLDAAKVREHQGANR